MPRQYGKRWLYRLLKIYYWLLGLLDIRSYWLCGQFALDKTMDHITDLHCTCILIKYTSDGKLAEVAGWFA